LGIVFEEEILKWRRKAEAVGWLQQKKRAAKKSGGRGAIKKRAAGRNIMKTSGHIAAHRVKPKMLDAVAHAVAHWRPAGPE